MPDFARQMQKIKAARIFGAGSFAKPAQAAPCGFRHD
jgi:hypothetical protein